MALGMLIGGGGGGDVVVVLVDGGVANSPAQQLLQLLLRWVVGAWLEQPVHPPARLESTGSAHVASLVLDVCIGYFT